MSKFYKIDTQGKHWLQRVGGLPSWTPADEARILYDTLDTTSPLYIGGSAGWLPAGQYGDVPLDTILLMESDVTILGYELLTDDTPNDGVVYVTKGSAAGGAAAGTDQGVQTFPNHAHSQSAHTHGVGSYSFPSGSTSLTTSQIASHRHAPSSGYGNFMSSSGSTHGESGDSYGTFTRTGFEGSGSGHTHPAGSASGNSGSGGGDNTGNQTAAITWANWKPRGRNFTRQKRI